MNTYTFHICPSLCEGFGHYISEGLSCGAVVITNNCAPMNELVNCNNGILIKNCIIHETEMKILECKITESSIENVIEQSILLDGIEMNKLKENAESSFQTNLKNFDCNINIVLTFICNNTI